MSEYACTATLISDAIVQLAHGARAVALKDRNFSPGCSNANMRIGGIFSALVVCLATNAIGADFSTVVPFRPTAEQRHRLEERLASLESSYDKSAAMLATRFSSPGYHTTLTGGTVHRTRDSLTYALALLDGQKDVDRDRAAAILTKVLSLQDTDPTSKTYGIWSWFLEESLAQMSPPDWNWADFCGVSLLQIARDHRNRLPPGLVDAIDAAIVHAAIAIQRRNVGPGYTNIALMGAYVTRLAGEHYGRADLRDYGAERLRRFQRHTRENGAFSEYNSPTYTLIALEEIGRMRRDFTDPELIKILQELYQIAWEEIALHFHVPTQQWAGPHSRAYGTLAGGNFHELVAAATQGRFKLARAGGSGYPDYRLELPCPVDLADYFSETKPRTVQRTYNRGAPDTVGTTVITSGWALGSVNRADLWNQRRPLIAYFGSARAPSFARVRMLRDGYDFAAAQFRSVQKAGRVIAGISFATDGGITHVSLDRMKNSAFTAHDFRLRFELGGAAASTSERVPDPPASPSSLLVLQRPGVTLRFGVPLAVFGNRAPRWETGSSTNEGGRDGRTLQADLVLHQGENATFDLAALARAALVLTFEIGDTLPPPLEPSFNVNDNTATVRWAGLELQVPVKPAPAAQLKR